ncbi:tumor susceptibility gene 101 protein-like [Dreissena polymorpha]|uniref:tumor susceptibility gene 101 protein-like n=1 Tax=Dreissena polymorpha TaxID=45954 RepID=UPI002264B416|nr:tumor susceptibility gene 101 protein-like [Dreissena polymorpha]
MASFAPLITSLLKKYKHPDVTKTDVLTALTAFGDLRPKFEDFVFNDGSTRQLVQLDGTIPVTYKGNVYNIPICIYLMDQHPYTPPIVCVKPTSTMEIKSGRHVDQNGKIDLPYLREWKYPMSDLLAMLQILVIVFGEETPVVTRTQWTNQSLPRYPVQGTPYPPLGGYNTTRLSGPVTGYPSIVANPNQTAINSTPYPGMMQAASSSYAMASYSDQTTGSDSSTIEDELHELQKLQVLLRCKMCKVRRVALTFLPCGHCIACEECGSKIPGCPMCPNNGAKVQGIVKTIFTS